MYKLEVYRSVDLIKTYIFLEDEYSNLIDYKTSYEYKGYQCRAWKEVESL